MQQPTRYPNHPIFDGGTCDSDDKGEHHAIALSIYGGDDQGCARRFQSHPTYVIVRVLDLPSSIVLWVASVPAGGGKKGPSQIGPGRRTVKTLRMSFDPSLNCDVVTSYCCFGIRHFLILTLTKIWVSA